MELTRKICKLAAVQFFLASCVNQPYDTSAYWVNVICGERYTYAIDVYGIFRDGAMQLTEFFEELTRGIGKKCQVPLTMKKYILDSADEIKENNETLKKPTSHSGQIWRTNVILLKDSQSLERVLDNEENLSLTWNPRDLFIVLLISETGTLVDINEINVILRSLWLRRQIQNVLLALPSSATKSKLAYSYDPFAKIDDNEWGRVENISLDSVSRVLKILQNLTPRRLRNFNGYTLNVGLYISSKQELKNLPPVFDVDSFMLKNVAKHLNFRMNVVKPEKGLKFGYQENNGTYVGSLGDVVHGRVNISFVSFFIKTYGKDGKNDVEFTKYVEFDRLCVVVPKAQEVPKWARIYHLFLPSTWLFFGLCHFVVHLSWYFLQTLDPRRTTPVDFQASVFRTFLLYSGCPVKLPTNSSERILLTGVFLASITIVGLFSGILYKSFAREMYYREIDSLSELDKSGLPITYGSLGLKDLFDDSRGTSSSLVESHLRKKLIYAHGGVNHTAIFRNTSALFRQKHFPVIDDNFIAHDGKHRLHLLSECPQSYYLAYLLPKNSILRDRVNAIISRLNQAGLPNLWHKIYVTKTIDRNKILNRSPYRVHWHDEHVAFKLTDVQTSFYTLIVGLLLSMLAFVAEIVFRHNIDFYKIRNDKSRSFSTKLMF